MKQACRFVRINNRSGRISVLEIPENRWADHPSGDDIAVALIEDTRSDWLISPLAWHDIAATRVRMQELNAGVGDEVFMLGRFIPNNPHGPHQPLARFGNIAMMPEGGLVKDGRGLAVEAFLLEMRSLSGFSGSPVFVYMGPGTYRGNGTMMPFFSETIGLIGVDTGHIRLPSPVLDGNNPTNMRVNLNTGVSIVSPVWKIAETLDTADCLVA